MFSNKMQKQDLKINKMNNIYIFNKLILNKEKDNNQSYVYILGQMYSHSIDVKYLFNACDFYILYTKTNTLYHSQMNSENCFANDINWNYSYFSKIRNCLMSNTLIKDTYFIFNEESENEGFEKIYKTYFELHFIYNNKDIKAFKMLLEKISQPNPYNFILNMSIDICNEKENSITEKYNIIIDKQKEINKIKNEKEQVENDFNIFKKESIIKMYLLLNEKKKKKEELLNKINDN